jgi:hypothetical protein
VVHLHHAETLAARRLHHPPPLHEGDALRAQCFQPRHFGVDVVGLDVQVHARGVVDLLHLDVQIAGRVAEHLVFAAVVAGIGVGDADAERAAPERGCRIEVIDVAVDDESGEAAAVGHCRSPLVVAPSRGEEPASLLLAGKQVLRCAQDDRFIAAARGRPAVS